LNIRDIEKGFRAAALKDGDDAFRQFLSAMEPVSPECPICHSLLTKIDIREKTIVSLMGTGRYERIYYECPNGHGHFVPCDEMVGIMGTSFTPGVRLVVSKLASAGSFEWASEALEEIAEIYVSPKETQRISESAGETIEIQNKNRIVEVMIPESPRSKFDEHTAPPTRTKATVYIEYDGTGIPVSGKELAGRKGKQLDGSAKTREVKLGCIFSQSIFDEKGDPIRDENSTSYVGAIENAESFGWRLFAEANLRGVESYERMVVIGDGAKWIWGIASQHFPNAIQIVDLYHAKEHLYELSRKLFTQQEERQTVLNEWLKTLEAGNIEILVAEIRAIKGLNDVQMEIASAEANYFTENSERMRYEKFNDMKLFVGSGVIEAGCKTVIGRRLKQSGMFWGLRGANAIIALRCTDLSCNKDLNSYFETICNQYRYTA
jgi:hypothetical protein